MQTEKDRGRQPDIETDRDRQVHRVIDTEIDRDRHNDRKEAGSLRHIIHYGDRVRAR